jgi:hypothetical protein
MRSSKLSDQFIFVGSDKLEQFLDIRKSQREKLRSQLPQGIYWFQVPDGRKICWNWLLIRDYLLNGPRPDHDRLVEKFLETLPENQTPLTREVA